ncbi:hypothetical protein BD779DRAFT_1529075 [Infundibulicybe gibba]|nr:hypothetical protein BD779DRAFT_1529075 [Infundibulicybe gibba]
MAPRHSKRNEFDNRRRRFSSCAALERNTRLGATRRHSGLHQGTNQGEVERGNGRKGKSSDYLGRATGKRTPRLGGSTMALRDLLGYFTYLE